LKKPERRKEKTVFYPCKKIESRFRGLHLYLLEQKKGIEMQRGLFFSIADCWKGDRDQDLEKNKFYMEGFEKKNKRGMILPMAWRSDNVSLTFLISEVSMANCRPHCRTNFQGGARKLSFM
jgi:hypothetical protein